MSNQTDILKASQLIVKHIAYMKANRFNKVKEMAVDFETFYNKVIGLAERADVNDALLNANNYGKDMENKILLKHYESDLKFLIDTCLKLGRRLDKEPETLKLIFDNIMSQNALEDNHNQVQEKKH